MAFKEEYFGKRKEHRKRRYTCCPQINCNICSQNKTHANRKREQSAREQVEECMPRERVWWWPDILGDQQYEDSLENFLIIDRFEGASEQAPGRNIC